MSPGPTVDVLGEAGGKPIVAGRAATRPTRPTGDLRLTTVSVTNPTREVEPRSRRWRPGSTGPGGLPARRDLPAGADRRGVEHAESPSQMVSSQDTAIAAALHRARLRAAAPTSRSLGVTHGGPSDGKLSRATGSSTVNGEPITDVDAGVRGDPDRPAPGEPVDGRRTPGRQRPGPSTVTTEASPRRPEKARRRGPDRHRLRLPVRRARCGIDDASAGPSAGLIFALGDLRHAHPGRADRRRTTSPAPARSTPTDGRARSAASSRRSSAPRTRAPSSSWCRRTTATRRLSADVDEDEIRLVKAPTPCTAPSTSLETYAQDPTADLPRCPT